MRATGRSLHVPPRRVLLHGTFLRSGAAFGLRLDLEQLKLLLASLGLVHILLGRAVKAGFTFGEQTLQRPFG